MARLKYTKNGVPHDLPMHGAVSSVNGRTGVVTGLAEESDLDALEDVVEQHSSDISNLGTDKQDKLIAGQNITIAADGKTISATGGGATYTAGYGISISDSNVISVSLPDADQEVY